MRIPIGHKIIVASVFLSWNLFGARAEDAADTVALFNGKDFSGWRFGPESRMPKETPEAWKIREGVIVGSADTGVDWTHPAIRGRYLGSQGHHLACVDPQVDIAHHGHPAVPCGQPSGLEDALEVMEEVGGDGFLIRVPFHHINRRFILEVTEGLVPALQRKGLVRTEYTKSTLRETLREF